MEDEIQKRQTAYKLWIKDLMVSQPVKQENPPLNYFKIRDKDISRVNIIANVVFKFEATDESFSSVTLDDGSGTVRVKVWKEDTKILKNLNVGDMLLVVGKPRYYNEETYINPEIVYKLDNPNWELLRKLELIKEYGKPLTIEKPAKEEVIAKPADYPTVIHEEKIVSGTIIPVNSRQTILKLIERLSKEGNGADVMEIIKESNIDEDEADSIIQDLLEEGEIFSPRPGKIKLLG